MPDQPSKESLERSTKLELRIRDEFVKYNLNSSPAWAAKWREMVALEFDAITKEFQQQPVISFGHGAPAGTVDPFSEKSEFVTMPVPDPQGRTIASGMVHLQAAQEFTELDTLRQQNAALVEALRFCAESRLDKSEIYKLAMQKANAALAPYAPADGSQGGGK